MNMSVIRYAIEFGGPFAEIGCDFINYKRTLGRIYSTEEKFMRDFCSFADSQGVKSPRADKLLVDLWIEKRLAESDKSQANRITFMRQFAIYLDARGFDAHIPGHHRYRKSSYAPYIFTHEEIKRMFYVCDNIEKTPHSFGPMRTMFPVMLRVLYGCGLRVSEMLKLTTQDVDLDQGTLLVRHGKYDRDRLIPMDETLIAAVKGHMARSNVTPRSNDVVFATRYSTAYSSMTVYGRFRDLLLLCGIPHLGRGRGPRLHDVRHTFAVHSLQKWVSRGWDINVMLPLLSAYMGHSSIGSTGRYVRLTADMYPDLVRQIEDVCGHVIPKVMP
jgi:integrase